MKAGSSSRCSARCLCNKAQISRLRGARSRSSATSRLRVFPVSTISSTRRICLPRSSVSCSYSKRKSPLEIAQENEASLEETEHQQLTVGVGRGDLLAELADPARNRLLIEDDPLELTPARLLEARRAW